MRDAQHDADQEQRDAQRRAAAESMRRYRERWRRGWRRVFVTIRDHEVDALLRAGLLAADRRDERDAIGNALGRLLDRIPPERWLRLLNDSASSW